MDQIVALDLAGAAESSPVATVVGLLSYLATYNGDDADLFPATGTCVSLTVF